MIITSCRRAPDYHCFLLFDMTYDIRLCGRLGMGGGASAVRLGGAPRALALQ